MSQIYMGVTRKLHSELNQLNKIIDYKIMRGLSYAAEARKHKILIARLYRTEKSQPSNSFSFFNHVFS